MPKKPRRLPHFYTFDQWQHIIKEWRESHLTISQYCQKHELTQSAFSRWLRRVTDSSSSGQSKESLKNVPSSPSLPEKELSFSTESDKRNLNPCSSFEKWKGLVEEWEKSGLSISAYCNQNDISQTPFRKWAYKFNPSLQKTRKNPAIVKKRKTPRQASNPSLHDLFIPVTIKPDSVAVPSSGSSSKVEVTLSQGHRLSIQGPLEWDNIIALLTPLLT